MRSLAHAIFTVSLSGFLSFPVFGQKPGQAETIGVVAVAEPPGPTAELAHLTLQLRSAIVERTPSVLDAAQLRDRMTGQTSTSTLTELDRAYAGALAMYQSGDFEGAVRTLRAVIEDLEKLPESGEAFDQWTRAMTRLARSEQTLGRKDEARAVIDRLVRAAPAIKVDATQYPASFAKQIEEAKAQLKSAPTRKLTVQATAKGAKVFLEGREVGMTPVTVTVPAGRYRVSGRVGDLRIPRFEIDLSSEDHTVTFDVALLESLRPDTGPGLALSAGDRSKALITTGALLGLDKLIATSFVVQGDVTYLAAEFYDVPRGMRLREGLVRLSKRQPPPGHLADLATFLVTGQQKESIETRSDHSEDRLDASRKNDNQIDVSRIESKRPASKTLGWTAFGLGVASIGFGAFAVVEGLSAKSSYDQASSMLEGNVLKPGADPASYNQAVSSGDSAKTRAMIGAGLAIGALTAGGILGYLSYKQTGEVGPFRF